MNCSCCGQLNPTEATFCMACTSRLTASDEMASALSADAIISSGFVGRQREMAELMAALEDARSGLGRLVMLAGEPGIGKTRTAQQLVAQAESSGCNVLWGRCYEEGGTPPYWPWLQALSSYINQQPPEQLQRDLGFPYRL